MDFDHIYTNFPDLQDLNPLDDHYSFIFGAIAIFITHLDFRHGRLSCLYPLGATTLVDPDDVRAWRFLRFTTLRYDYPLPLYYTHCPIRVYSMSERASFEILLEFPPILSDLLSMSFLTKLPHI